MKRFFKKEDRIIHSTGCKVDNIVFLLICVQTVERLRQVSPCCRQIYSYVGNITPISIVETLFVLAIEF